MFRDRTYTTPVPLDALDREPAGLRAALLGLLQLDGVRRVSVVRRGGDNLPIAIEPDEAIHIEPSGGRWPKPAEDRYGQDVRVPGLVVYSGASGEIEEESEVGEG